MKNTNALFTNNTDIWETPKNIYNFYKNKGYYDPCPINPKEDGLKTEWKQKNFVNPPYSKLKKWVIKSIEEMQKNKKVVLLIPSRTDTQAFKLLYESNAEIIFLEGRLCFSESKTAPFPSMIVKLDLNNKEAKMRLMSKKEKQETFGD